uniref:Uncharacterized protein n=1 Tax=Cacopsylla melanoneura TaxID=428564 RepID=A0A8D9DSD8_9HEMI
MNVTLNLIQFLLNKWGTELNIRSRKKSILRLNICVHKYGSQTFNLQRIRKGPNFDWWSKKGRPYLIGGLKEGKDWLILPTSLLRVCAVGQVLGRLFTGYDDGS